MFDQIIVIVGVTFLVMISPGPDMIIVMRNTIAGGRSAGIKTSLGILTGNMIHIGYCVVGIGLLISQSILAFAILKYAGAAYLVYLGVMSFRADRTRLDIPKALPDRPDRTWFLQGFINNILNPKGTLFYLGIFTMVITPETTVGATLILIACMVAVSTSFWLFFVATLDHPAVRKFIERFQQVTNRIFGALLIALGVRVALMDR
ncbi:MAG: LysE family translocator [Proteobacteria bacterium]|nr:LysE family translocator [Pseudomonadota bacterium]MDA0993639.1 LysE family translocator [Pseudomonadota bacterium]